MTPLPKDIEQFLNGVFEVKLDDKQQGYLWAKLSPKSKKKLTTLITNLMENKT